MKDCCHAGPTNKQCQRLSNKKLFNLPRKFDIHKCLSGQIKGFTMRASCAPYKNCKL